MMLRARVALSPVILAVALFVVPLASTASGTNAALVRSPRTGVLAFTCGGCPGADTASRLFTIRTDGTHLHGVANGVGAYGPRWSPDGRTLAVSRQFQEIWLANADGSNWRRLTKPPAEDRGQADESPSWFPDASHLLFVRGTPPPAGSSGPSTNRTALWTKGVSARAAERVLAAPVSAGPPEATNVVSPDVSRDGRRIAFNDVSERLWVARASGAHPRRLGLPGFPGRDPRWSPDGRRVVFLDAEASALRILDVRTNGVRTLVDGDVTDAYAWSPDGRWLAVAVSREYECDDPTSDCYDLEFWIVNAENGRHRQIFRTDYGEIYGLDWGAPRR